MNNTEDDIKLEDLEFHENLGEGGGGTVGRVIFKKPFKGYTEAAAKTVYSLRKEEVEIMRKLRHPNVVTFLGFYKKGPINMIILEYAKNGSLHDYLKDQSKPLPLTLMQKWLKEAALALAYLHDENVLHRDIKANNCLLFADSVLKLCDFGLAREIEHSQTTSSMKGTFRYMAPELIVGNAEGRAVYSKPADIYAYGMLILEIFSRNPPFADLVVPNTIMFRVGRGEQPTIPENCPQLWSEIMKQCWDKNPQQRPTIQNILKGSLFEESSEESMKRRKSMEQNDDVPAKKRFESNLLQMPNQSNTAIAGSGKPESGDVAEGKIVQETLENSGKETQEKTTHIPQPQPILMVSNVKKLVAAVGMHPGVHPSESEEEDDHDYRDDDDECDGDAEHNDILYDEDNSDLCPGIDHPDYENEAEDDGHDDDNDYVRGEEVVYGVGDQYLHSYDDPDYENEAEDDGHDDDNNYVRGDDVVYGVGDQYDHSYDDGNSESDLDPGIERDWNDHEYTYDDDSSESDRSM